MKFNKQHLVDIPSLTLNEVPVFLGFLYLERERHIKTAERCNAWCELWHSEMIRQVEEVKHIDGIRADNRFKNLFLCKNKSEHKKIEDSCKALVLQMYQAGLVKFNRIEKRYEMV